MHDDVKILETNFSSTLTENVALIFPRTCAELIYRFFPFTNWYDHIFVSSEVPPISLTSFTTLAPVFKRNSSSLSVLNMCAFIYLYTFIWKSYVTTMIVADCRVPSFALYIIIFASLLDFTYLSLKIFSL